MIIKYNNHLLFKPKNKKNKISDIYFIGSKRIVLKYIYDSVPNMILHFYYKKDIYIHFSRQFDYIEVKAFQDECCSKRCKIPDFISLDKDFRTLYNRLLKCS